MNLMKTHMYEYFILKNIWLLNHYQPNIYEDHSERIIKKSHFELDIH